MPINFAGVHFNHNELFTILKKIANRIVNHSMSYLLLHDLQNNLPCFVYMGDAVQVAHPSRFGRRIPTCVFHGLAGVVLALIPFVPKTTSK